MNELLLISLIAGLFMGVIGIFSPYHSNRLKAFIIGFAAGVFVIWAGIGILYIGNVIFRS